MSTHAIHMTGEEAKAIRLELGWTLQQMGEAMGMTGKFARTNYFQFESGRRTFSFPQAHLLRAMKAGYRPFGFDPAKVEKKAKYAGAE